MIKGVLCSSGAMVTRFNGRDPRVLRGVWRDIEADGLEFMIYPSWDGRLEEIEETVRGISRELSMDIPVVHADKRIGELLSLGSDEQLEEARARFIAGLGIARRLGAGLIVLHLWGGAASDYHIKRNLSVLGDYYEEAEKRGLMLTVENVVCAKKTPLYHLKTIMRDFPEARFTIDTKMAEFHAELSETVACEALWSGRVSHLHVNDFGGTPGDFSDLRVLHIGEGHVDFAPFFKKVRESGYEGFATIESTSVFPDGSINVQKLNRSLNRVRDALKE